MEAVAPSRMGSGFRWLLASSWISNIGDGIALAAGPLLVASQTSNPALVAGAGAATVAPQLLLGLYAGALCLVSLGCVLALPETRDQDFGV